MQTVNLYKMINKIDISVITIPGVAKLLVHQFRSHLSQMSHKLINIYIYIYVYLYTIVWIDVAVVEVISHIYEIDFTDFIDTFAFILITLVSYF